MHVKVSPDESNTIRTPRGAAFKNNFEEPDLRLASMDKTQAKQIFAARLQAAMDAKGWSQSDLARNATRLLPPGTKKEIGRDNVSNWVRGVHLPGSIFLNAVAQALGKEPTDLLPSRAVPSAKDTAPPLDVRDRGDGHVYLRVNRRVPFSVAVAVMKLLQDLEKED